MSESSSDLSDESRSYVSQRHNAGKLKVDDRDEGLSSGKIDSDPTGNAFSDPSKAIGNDGESPANNRVRPKYQLTKRSKRKMAAKIRTERRGKIERIAKMNDSIARGAEVIRVPYTSTYFVTADTRLRTVLVARDRDRICRPLFVRRCQIVQLPIAAADEIRDRIGRISAGRRFSLRGPLS